MRLMKKIRFNLQLDFIGPIQDVELFLIGREKKVGIFLYGRALGTHLEG
jgi:hypothetical protein